MTLQLAYPGKKPRGSVVTTVVLALLMPVAACATPDAEATLAASSLPGLDGHAHRIDDWRGKVRLVNFWASWCSPCRSEIPLLAGTREAWHARGVEVIGVTLDNPDEARAFVKEARIDYPVLVADQRGQALMQSVGNASGVLPFTLLIDRHGRIVQRHAGLLDARRLEQWLADAAEAH